MAKPVPPAPVPNRKVAGYAAGVAQRTADAKAPPSLGGVRLGGAIPFDPKKDPGMTLEQIGRGQANMERMMGGDGAAVPRVPGLSHDTVAGLSALKAQVEATQKAAAPAASPAAPAAAAPAAAPAATPPAAEAPPPPAGTIAPKPVSAREALDRMDDLEMERLFRGIQNDVINNAVERDAIRKRVEPIDLVEGISKGEFRQWVPIIPNKLEVEYRSLSGFENHNLRLLLYKFIAEDRNKENIAAELFGLMQTCAAVATIKGIRKEPEHMTGTDVMNREFDEAVFRDKYKRFSSQPAPMLHALSTHALWFDERVREAFSTENVKNS